MLNGLHQFPDFHYFYMQQRGPQINHLSFADDTIIFTSGRTKSLQLIMKVLATYESMSGQQINKNKSHFIVPDNAFTSTIARVK